MNVRVFILTLYIFPLERFPVSFRIYIEMLGNPLLDFFFYDEEVSSTKKLFNDIEKSLLLPSC